MADLKKILVPGGSTGSSVKNNFTATTDPTATDDSDAGYSVGSVWINTTADERWVCLDSTVGSAVWEKSTTGTASEIVNTPAGNVSATDVQGAINELDTEKGDMDNPMTTSGDVIYGGTSGTPTRLAKGSDDDVLTLKSGVPSWETPSGGGGVSVENKTYQNKKYQYTANGKYFGIFKFNSDGTKALGRSENGEDKLHTLTLTTAYDLSTASITASYTFPSNFHQSLSFSLGVNDNGTKVFSLQNDSSAKKVYLKSLTLTTGFDASTAGSETTFEIYDYNSNEKYGVSPVNLISNSDGSKLWWINGSYLGIREYSLSTPGDITTATYTKNIYMPSTTYGWLTMQGDATAIYMRGYPSHKHFLKYSLSTAGDLGTISTTPDKVIIPNYGDYHSTLSYTGMFEVNNKLFLVPWVQNYGTSYTWVYEYSI